ncbi:hypothetical protein diail_7199, partial [Diaporthe ilicicola]
MSGKTYLITGAHRGIGRGLFDHYVALPNNTVVAAVRNVEGAQDLLNVPYKGENTTVVVVKIDSSSRTDPFEAVKSIQAQGIDHLDVVISSAGIAKLNTVEDMPLEELEEVLMINTFSVMLLYKATLPLLRKSSSPRFVFISAAGGSLNEMQKYPYPNLSYGGSKVLANYMVVKMGMENDWLITLLIHPGLVQTDMGNGGARAFGLEEAPTTLKDSSKNTAHIIDNATKKDHSEKFFNETIDQIHP